MKSVKALAPAYYEKFICIGNACEDNCCEADWRIYIDKHTYNLYRNIKDPDFKRELPNRVKRVRGNEASDHHYAQIVLDENGHCSYLENGMCSIQLKHGFKYLGVTCLIFPRKQLRLINGVLETALSMACPEAIRIGLYPSEPMAFKVIEIENTHSKSLAALPVLRFDESINILAKHAVVLRQACIDIMQTRSMTIADRILAIGMMLKKLREQSDTGDWDSTPVTAMKYALMASEGHFDNLLASFPDNAEIKVTVKTKLHNTALSMDGNKRAFKNIIPPLERYAKRLGKEPASIIHIEFNEMIEEGTEYWKGFLEKRSHILENYFVNFIFGNVFPFYIKLGIEHQVLLLAEAYALYKILLSAPAGYDGGITDENLIETITHVFRHSSHGGMINTLTENYILSGFDSLAHISFLLRD
jgi:lysine-N-methylase